MITPSVAAVSPLMDDEKSPAWLNGEISGLEDHEFDKAYDKAANIAGDIMQHEGDKMDKFLEHMAKEIDNYFDHYGGKLFK